jgi:rSAM/selenodomain-associated transferase 1
VSVRNTLVIFAKTPRLGAVKHRLGIGIGALAATAFQRDTVRNMLRRLGHDPRWQCELAVTPDRDVGDPLWDRLGAGPVARTVQGPGDLGRRMARALAAAAPGPAVLIGSDIPDIRPRHIDHAFRALGCHDLVFGPAADGGYWLVGVRHPRHLRGIFRNIRWSTEHALADTRANIPSHRSVALVETLSDVDDEAAYRAWRKRR